jgi:hypothetical protein
MAGILFNLLKPEAYSSMHCQIVLLHVQSNRRESMAVLQPLHDWRRNFVMIFSTFSAKGHVLSLWRAASSVSALA